MAGAGSPWVVLVVLMAVFAALLPIGQARNYGLFSIFVTPLVIVQLDRRRRAADRW